MSELLEIIDNSLQEVEEQLLQEFDRIRNSLSDARFAPVDSGVKNALSEVVEEMHHRLDQSGDRQNLQLMTEDHEVLLTRISVLRRLLDANVPTAYLHEAHDEVSTSRRQLEAKVVARRASDNPVKTTPDSKPAGFMGKIKGMFGHEVTEKEVSRNKIRVTEEEAKALQPVNVYLDNGIYSASRELALLVSVFDLPDHRLEQIQADHKRRIEGKAQFTARDITAQGHHSVGSEGHQSPYNVRSKLSERSSASSGRATFDSKDIEHSQAKEAQTSAGELARKRREELEQEKAERPTTGKASFVSRDLEPITPQEMPRRLAEPKPKPKIEPEPEAKEEKPRTGRAVFESRDLSKPPPVNKR